MNKIMMGQKGCFLFHPANPLFHTTILNCSGVLCNLFQQLDWCQYVLVVRVDDAAIHEHLIQNEMDLAATQKAKQQLGSYYLVRKKPK